MERIDRMAALDRHPIVLTKDSKAPAIPVGNGELCFTGDVSGLQCRAGNIMANWAWHSFPLPEGVRPEDLPETGSYMTGRLRGDGQDLAPADRQAAREYMRVNAHKVNLGRLCFAAEDGEPLGMETFEDAVSRGDVRRGLTVTEWRWKNGTVKTEVCVHGREDVLAVRVTSEGPLPDILLAFPYPSLAITPVVGDFDRPDAHVTAVTGSGCSRHIDRSADDLSYSADLRVTGAEIEVGGKRHTLLIRTSGTACTVVLRFSPLPVSEPLPTFGECLAASEEETARYFLTGGAIDLSASSNENWFEFERRTVLSQYLMRVQSCGSWPSAEAGLMFLDPWHNRFHMEMDYWHHAHFAMWNKPEYSDRPLSVYRSFLPMAKKLAAQLGYRGAKWGKSCAPDARTSPWNGNLALLWKQPHPMTFAELEYRCRPTAETLEKWADILDETAVHMADYPTPGADGLLHLDPSMPPSELGFTRDTLFDLVYWKWGLRIANLWRERMGRPRVPEWDDVAAKLAPLPEKDGLYIRSPEYTETYEKQNYEHPDMVGVLGMIPDIGAVDRDTVHASLLAVWEKWDRSRVWGWDFPWIAMCASRVGEPRIAVEAMLSLDMDEVGCSSRGCYPYLPANGGYLYAAAMMAVGADGENAPGFDAADGWKVRSEGILAW